MTVKCSVTCADWCVGGPSLPATDTALRATLTGCRMGGQDSGESLFPLRVVARGSEENVAQRKCNVAFTMTLHL
ncbi:hypothetical protein E2C01_038493 [Portunus trituberculatus]|uniref:Uncharacterized protein n=1 Tax=Portunus trituberculatus TaxID=210409 RepID=A0A5B7FI51_PORTR|nr:hypothetical protein [Portunus trituberculatus]